MFGTPKPHPTPKHRGPARGPEPINIFNNEDYLFTHESYQPKHIKEKQPRASYARLAVVALSNTLDHVGNKTPRPPLASS